MTRDEWSARATRNRNRALVYLVLSVAGIIPCTAIFFATNERLLVIAILLHMLYLVPAAFAWTAYLIALRGMDSATRLDGLLAALDPKEETR